MAHVHSDTLKPQKTLILALTITTIFMLVEIIGGWLAGSLALIADAGHMLTDSMALFLALLAARMAHRKPAGIYTFGWIRMPTLVALINSIILLFITILIIWEAIQRFTHPQPIASGMMLTVAIAGLIANLVCFKLLHHAGSDNINIRAAALHVLADLLGSAGAIIASLLIMYTNTSLFDPILSILVSLLIVGGAWSLLRESGKELLEAAPDEMQTERLATQLTQSFNAIKQVHHLHIWQIADRRCLTLHVQITITDHQDKLLHEIHHWLKTHYQIAHATIQLEHQICADGECDMTNHAVEQRQSCHHLYH